MVMCSLPSVDLNIIDVQVECAHPDQCLHLPNLVLSYRVGFKVMDALSAEIPYFPLVPHCVLRCFFFVFLLLFFRKITRNI